nr:serine/threonine protein kinase [Deltaproteobacteria bacterium]
MAEWTPPEELDEYRLVRLLGRGAMGAVYLAHDQLLDRPVAVKFVRAADDPVARSRALEEARAIARLQHPNVVAIYRIAETARPPYLVSEYVRGTTLDEIARPVPWKEMLPLAIDLARGLAAAHRSGVLHRDVKPANAILADDGRGKLLDFGLARAIDAEPVFLPPRERAESPPIAVDVTRSSPARGSSPSVESDSFDREAPEGSPLDLGNPGPREAGTPLYMAPELWRGEPATRRSDLYAFGVLLYELLAGTAPRRGMAIAELGEAVQNADIPRLTTAAPGVDAAFAAVVDRLVERDPGARFASAEALLVALEEIAEPRPLSVPDGNPYRGLAA